MSAPTPPPRITPIPPRQWSEEVRAGLSALQPPDAKYELRRAEGAPKALNALGTLAHHPQLAHAFHSFNGHILTTTTLTPRQRELLVLRVGHVRGAEYEWKQHVVVGRQAGLSDDEIACIADGPDAERWAPIDAAMLRAVDELLADAMVSDETWAVLAASLDTQQLMDVVFTVGAYDVLAMAFRSFRIEVDADLRAAVP
jgi:alkylhydroperoxidase family enzyme